MRETPITSADSRTPPGARLPDLRIVPSASLLLHEECDPGRVERLARVLIADGVLRNPPVVAQLDRGAYVVLDGANRVTALQQAELPDQLVQVVDYADPAVSLEVWAHLLQGDGVLIRSEGSPSLAWRPMPEETMRDGLEDGGLACGVLGADGAFGLPSGAGLADRLRDLCEVVIRYKGRVPIFRVQNSDLGDLAREYGRAAALVLFPRFTKQDIRAIARLPVKLPTGISRHVIPQRALRVNLDLALLRADQPTAEKQALLDALVRARLLEHRVRHYPEPTVLYDE